MAKIEDLIELYPERKSQILRMYSKNHLLAKDESGIIVNDDCLSILGEDKVTLISSFPDIAAQVVKLDSQTLQLIARLIERYQQCNDTSEWTYLFSDILKNISEYSALINALGEEQISLMDNKTLDNLINIMIDSNTYDISNIQNIIDFQKIRDARCKKTFEEDSDFEVKVDMVLTSKYGISKKYARELLKKFGEDIDSIKDEKLKQFIKSLSQIYNMTNSEESIKKLDTIMQQDAVDSLNISEGFNRLSLEKNLRKSYMQLYLDKGLFSISDATLIDSEMLDVPNNQNIYELPCDKNGIVDFNLLVHDINVALDRSGITENYYNSWNRCEMNTPHICASYIRRDYLTTAGNGICFAFNGVSQDDLIASSPTDSHSNMDGLTTVASDEYYSPDKQIRKTGMIDEYNYNEVDISRFVENNGELEPRQPDYIIVFKSRGAIPNLQDAQRISEDFEKHTGKKLPILIIDKDKCRETELLQIAKLQLEYENNPTSELATQINDKKEMLLREGVGANFIEDSIKAYQISLMQMELERNPLNDELQQKVEQAKQNYINELISEGRIASDETIETDSNIPTDKENQELWDDNIDTGIANEFSDDDSFEIDDESASWGDGWDEEIDDNEIMESFNKLISKKCSIIQEYAEKGRRIAVKGNLLTDEKIRQIARDKSVVLRKEFGQQAFDDLEIAPEVNKGVKSFEAD